MSKKNIDFILKELVTEQYENIVSPPSQEVWQIVRKRLEEERKQNFLRKYKIALTAGIIIILAGVASISYQTTTMALANRMIRSIGVLVGDTFQVHKNFNNGQSPVSDSRIDDIRTKAKFQFIVPQYIPENYTLLNAKILDKFEDRQTVSLIFKNSKSDDPRDCFEITQENYTNRSDVTMNISTDKDTTIEKIKAGSTEYTLVNYDMNYHILLWDRENISYNIDGALSKKEILAIAKSMK